MTDKPKRKTRVMSGRGAKAKGSDYERELSAHLNGTLGLSSRRALLSGGGRNDGGSDLDGTPLIHVEAKRTETFAPYAAMQQAEESISRGSRIAMPVVIQRRNRMTTGQSMVVMRMDDWMKMYAAFLREQGVAFGVTESTFESLLKRGSNAVQSASH
jgi:hypothetical protein